MDNDNFDDPIGPEDNIGCVILIVFILLFCIIMSFD